MRLTTPFTLVALLVPVATSVLQTPVSAQNPSGLSVREQQIQTRWQQQNGISIGEPKLYDDALLQEMLNAAQARLAALQ